MTPEQIVDYYGTTFEVEDLMGGPGPLVDVSFDDHEGASGRFRFTPEGACDLADALLRAAGWPEKATRP